MLNTTGVSNTDDYHLGRGKVFVGDLDANGRPDGKWRFLGNVPEIKTSVATEQLEHESSISGLKTVDATVPLGQKMSLTMVLEELNDQNAAMFLSGETSAPTNRSVAGFAEWEMVPAGDLSANTWYDIKGPTGLRAYDVQAADLTVKTTNASPVTLVSGTSYTLDSEMGMIFVKDTAAVTTAISGGEGLDVTLALDAAASVLQQVSGLVVVPTPKALKFIEENARTGLVTEFIIYKVTLVADGDLSLIGNEITKMPLKGTAEQNVDSLVITKTSVVTPR